MTDWIFSTPLWVFVLLLFAAGVLLFTGNNRQEKRLISAGGGVLIFALILALLSYFFDTDKETVLKRTRQLVAAVDQRDWKALEPLLDPRVSFALYGDRDALIAGAGLTADRIGLKEVKALETDIDNNGGIWTVSMSVLSTQDVTMGQSIPTNWQFDWQDTGKGWVVYKITPLPSKFISPEMIKAWLVDGKK